MKIRHRQLQAHPPRQRSVTCRKTEKQKVQKIRCSAQHPEHLHAADAEAAAEPTTAEVPARGPLPLVPAASVALLRPSIYELPQGGVGGRVCAAGHDSEASILPEQDAWGARAARSALPAVIPQATTVLRAGWALMLPGLPHVLTQQCGVGWVAVNPRGTTGGLVDDDG